MLKKIKNSIPSNLLIALILRQAHPIGIGKSEFCKSEMHVLLK